MLHILAAFPCTSTVRLSNKLTVRHSFTGRLANNTNLAAKGIVALEAFAQLCTATGGSGCSRYSEAAVGFAKTWTEYGLEQQPQPHYKIAYNFPNSYSIKYNLVGQKLLNYSGPFPWHEVVAKTEVPYCEWATIVRCHPCCVCHTSGVCCEIKQL